MRFSNLITTALAVAISQALTDSVSTVVHATVLTVEVTHAAAPTSTGGGGGGTSSIINAPAATGPQAAANQQQQIQSMCSPLNNSTGHPDLNSPCNVATLIRYECVYGRRMGMRVWKEEELSKLDNHQSPRIELEQSNDDQRICACESQFFDELEGCAACEKAHGGTEVFAFLQGKGISSISSAYCALTSTPTTDLPHYISAWMSPTSVPTSISVSEAGARSESYSDPLASSTAVSLYYTPAVTGAEAWRGWEDDGEWDVGLG